MPQIRSRREAAFFMLAREFWALWARAFVCVALTCLVVLGAPAHAATMRTSFYGAESGRLNADGSRFNPMGFTAASWSLPFGTRLQVCFRGCAVVTVRDRGPAVWTGRSLDLSHGAARAIGLEAVGVADIDVTVLGQGRAVRRTGHRPLRHVALRRFRIRRRA